MPACTATSRFDGRRTAYVPSKGCGGQQSVVVSENNGLTWEVRKVPGSKEGETDPSVGMARTARFFRYANGDGHQRVAVSHDKGKTCRGT